MLDFNDFFSSKFHPVCKFLESKIVVLIMKRGSQEGMQVIPMLDLNHSFASNSILLCTIFWNPRSSSLIMKHGSQEGRCASHSNA